MPSCSYTEPPTQSISSAVSYRATPRVTIRFGGAKVGDEDCYTKELGSQVRYITSVLAVPIQVNTMKRGVSRFCIVLSDQ